MKQLQVKELKRMLKAIKSIYNLSEQQLNNMPIVLGDDEELNGVHEAYFCQLVEEPKEIKQSDVELGKISWEQYCENELAQQIKQQTDVKGKCILIS